MFYSNLGNPAGFTGCSPHCLANVAPFTNLQSYQYWSLTEYTGSYYSGDNAWIIDMQDGFQGAYVKSGGNYAWAVRDGDVAAIPEPKTYALMLAGLALVGAAVRRRG